MNLSKRKLVVPASRIRVASALLALGVPSSMLRERRMKVPFWQRRINHLAVLDCARDCWRASIRQAHPDRGGSNDCAAKLNKLWNHVRRAFKQQGHELA
jgi:hypothetical protein